jgi:hypothetical protein
MRALARFATGLVGQRNPSAAACDLHGAPTGSSVSQPARTASAAKPEARRPGLYKFSASPEGRTLTTTRVDSRFKSVSVFERQ